MGIIIRNGHEYSGDSSVSLTQSQYDALEQQGLVNPDVTYFITNTSASTTDAVYANQVAYDNTTSGLNTTTAQGAIDLLATEATVKQTDVTAGVSPSTTKYPLLLSGVSTSGTLVDVANKSDNLFYNPSNRALMSYGTTKASVGVKTTNNNITGTVYLTAGTSGNKSILFGNGSSTISAIKCDANNDISFSTEMQTAIKDSLFTSYSETKTTTSSGTIDSNQLLDGGIKHAKYFVVAYATGASSTTSYGVTVSTYSDRYVFLIRLADTQAVVANTSITINVLAIKKS